MNKVNFYGASIPAYATKEEFENSNTIKDLENSKNSINNGGNTDYYALPRPRLVDIEELVKLAVSRDISAENVAEAIDSLLPSTLNDLIEYKNMLFWRGEIFKALYALEERAVRSSNNASRLRELNKIVYYAQRAIKMEGENATNPK